MILQHILLHDISVQSNKHYFLQIYSSFIFKQQFKISQKSQLLPNRITSREKWNQ